MTLREAFEHQAISCARLGSPFMEQLFGILAQHWPDDSALGRYFDGFEGDVGPAGASLPLRIAGGLHALVLSGRAPDLARVYPPERVSDATLRPQVSAALAAHEDFLLDFVKSPPQTNEVRRSAALMAGATVLRGRYDLPVVLSELGASGGLNLMWDRFALALPGLHIGPAQPVLTLSPAWEGPLPAPALPRVAGRAGVDLNPLPPADPANRLRLMAYLWPDQPERLALTSAAAAAAAGEVVRGDAIDWLEQRLGETPEGHVHLIQNTVAWQYFPPAAQKRGRALIEAAGAAATPTRPLAWLTMETDGDTKGALGAALTLRLWPGDITLDLGRADFHGRWIMWKGAA